MLSIKDLIIYPVKSMQGLSLSDSHVTENGFPFDHIFIITTADGRHVTAHNFPQLVQFNVTLIKNGIVISYADNHQTMEVYYSDCSKSAEMTTGWDAHFPSYIAAIKVNQWLSNLLQHDVQLRWLGQHSRRHSVRSNKPTFFTHHHPYRLINENSFEVLKQRCTTKINIAQFRTNIIIKNTPAFAEDSWKTIRIGEVIFDLIKPYNHGSLINIDPDNGLLSLASEPLQTLQKFRRRNSGDIDFGWLMVARNAGLIKVNDSIEVLATQPAYHYPTQSEQHNHDPVKPVTIDYNGYRFAGNNQQILLEQLEQQGIQIPYSCRSGICTQCRITLTDGTVAPLRENAILRNGMVLSCSCKPMSDLKLTRSS